MKNRSYAPIFVTILFLITALLTTTARVQAELPPRPTKTPEPPTVQDDPIPADQDDEAGEENDVLLNEVEQGSSTEENIQPPIQEEDDSLLAEEIEERDTEPLPERRAQKEREQIPPPSGTILLNIENAGDELWSVVQWQDVEGNWHDVDGWRGMVNGGETIWWVEEEQWGRGPFRWVTYTQADESYLSVSAPFHLPNSGEWLIVMMNLSEM